MANNSIIKAKLRKILPTLDYETATQRTIQQQLEEELGIPLEEYKTFIKEEVDLYLMEEQDPNAFENPPPPAKKQRTEAPGPATSAALPKGFLFCAPIATKRFAGVRTYKGKPMVDVREFYEKDSELLPGAKGLSMTPQQWATLLGGLGAITGALGAADAAFYVNLGSGKRAAISDYNGKLMVSLREYYEKNAKWLPGKKGISLPPDQWAKLCAAREELTRHLEGAPGGKITAAAAAGGSDAGGAGPSTAAAAVAAAAVASGSAPAASPAAPPAEGPMSVQLSTNRRAEVSNWKGNLGLDVREMYEKDGELKPTKKGLLLQPAMVRLLSEKAAEISAALAAQDAAFEVALGPKRKLTISSYKGRWSVDMREFYEKDGKLAPTPKGISLGSDQWEKLAAALPAFDAAVHK